MKGQEPGCKGIAVVAGGGGSDGVPIISVVSTGVLIASTVIPTALESCGSEAWTMASEAAVASVLLGMMRDAVTTMLAGQTAVMTASSAAGTSANSPTRKVSRSATPNASTLPAKVKFVDTTCE